MTAKTILLSTLILIIYVQDYIMYGLFTTHESERNLKQSKLYILVILAVHVDRIQII